MCPCSYIPANVSLFLYFCVDYVHLCVCVFRRYFVFWFFFFYFLWQKRWGGRVGVPISFNSPANLFLCCIFDLIQNKLYRFFSGGGGLKESETGWEWREKGLVVFYFSYKKSQLIITMHYINVLQPTKTLVSTTKTVDDWRKKKKRINLKSWIKNNNLRTWP